MFHRHVAALHVVEREIVIVVNCKNGHRRSEARKCRTSPLMGIHAADCVEITRVCVDVVAKEHEGVGADARGDDVEQSIANAQALEGGGIVMDTKSVAKRLVSDVEIRTWSMQEPNANVVTRCAVEDEFAKTVGCSAPARHSGASAAHRVTSASAAWEKS
jgi:hypothetical protein